MSTLFSRSARSQTLFTYGISLPTPLSEVVIQVPCSGINPECMYTGQTEPALMMTLISGRSLGLDSTSWTYSLNVDKKSTGVASITSGKVTFATGANGDPVFSHTWLTGEVQVSGTFLGQIKARRVSDNYPMYFDTFSLRRYTAI